jgi:cytochrome o ubiquinol oxidase subunit 2
MGRLLGGVLDPQGPIGAGERLILINATVVMLAVIIPVIVLTLGFAWWFRAGNTKARYMPDWEYSGPVELVVWSIPALVVVFLGGMAWISSHDLDPPKPLASATAKPLEIQVVSLDWKWLFIYPEQGVASVNRLTVPAGTPLHFSITSSGVMNSFFVPQLGSQIYAMAGMTTRLVLQADKPGTYPGRSVQFSGDGFSDMRFDVVALEPAAFDDWVRQTKGAGGTLDPGSYSTLTKPGTVSQPSTWGTVSPDLFQAAIQQAVK